MSVGENDLQVARTSLANERTLLAWNRTGLALISAGVAVAKLFPALAIPGGGVGLGVLLIGVGAGGMGTGYARWRANEARIRQQRPLKSGRGPHLLAAGMAVVVVVALVIALAR